MMAARRITRRIPGALIAVVGAIIASRVADLAAHGVSVLGYVPRGLPAFGLPAFGLHDTLALLGTSGRFSSSSWPRARPPPARTRPSTTSRSAPTPT
jgi:hypothetical protein